MFRVDTTYCLRERGKKLSFVAEVVFHAENWMKIEKDQVLRGKSEA